MSRLASARGTEPALDLSVVICSFNGSSSVVRCLESLRRQSVGTTVEVIVVDDGSTDDTASLAEGLGARVLRHTDNLGVAAARNTGLQASRAAIVAFLDDDCEVPEGWARSVLRTFEEVEDEVVAVGGSLIPEAPPGPMRGYVLRNNPSAPLELDLAKSPRLPYRLARYLVRAWTNPPECGRFIFSFAGASMSFRTAALREVGGFDAGLRLGPEDLDVCIRLRARFGDRSLWFDPRIAVIHHYRAGLHDFVRRSHAYGRGHAAMLKKYPSMRPTIFPLPLTLITLGFLGCRRRGALALAIMLPLLVHPRGARRSRAPAGLLDAYITTLQEASFLTGAFGPGSGTISTLLARHGWGRCAR